MNRRTFLNACLGAAGAITLADRADAAGLPKSKITRIRYYKTPTDAAGRPNVRQPLFNQSTNVVLIETDSGLIGVGEGGASDTMEQCAGQHMLYSAVPVTLSRREAADGRPDRIALPC